MGISLPPSLIVDRVEEVIRRLHGTNYEDHLELYLSKSESIENPCAWSKSHRLIANWLSTGSTPKLFISGGPGTGKSVLTAHIINTTKEVAGHREVLLYYFCGADPTVDQYTHGGREASSKAIVLAFMRQIVSAYHQVHHSMTGLDSYNMASLGEVVDDVMTSRRDMFSELKLRGQIANLLKSFDTVRCIYCLPLYCLLLLTLSLKDHYRP